MKPIICPKCKCDYCYNDSMINVCPECAHEFTDEVLEQKKYYDSNGAQLFDGDTVSVIKDLKINGSSNVIKQGTKVKNIKLQEGDHDIRCKIDGLGNMELKTQFVKKIK